MKGILSGSSKTRRGFCPGSANLSEGGFVWRGLCLDTVQNILIKKKVYTLLYDLIYKCYRYLLYITITCTCTQHRWHDQLMLNYQYQSKNDEHMYLIHHPQGASIN